MQVNFSRSCFIFIVSRNYFIFIVTTDIMPAPKPHIDDLFVNGKVASWFIPSGLIHSGGHAVCTIRLMEFQGGELDNFKMMIKK